MSTQRLASGAVMASALLALVTRFALAHQVTPDTLRISGLGKTATFTCEDLSGCTANMTATPDDPSIASVDPPSATHQVTQQFTVTAMRPGTTIIQLHFLGDAPPNCTEDGHRTVFVTVVDSIPPKPQTAANTPNATTQQDPVNTATGELLFQEPPDLWLGGPMTLMFRRQYGSMLSRDGAIPVTLGLNWSHNFNIRLVNGPETLTVVTATGEVIRFTQSSTGLTLASPRQTPFQLVALPTGGHLLLDPQNNFFYTFDVTGALTRIEDEHGNALTLSYTGGLLTQVTDSLGRQLQFTYDAQGFLTGVGDGTRTAAFAHQGNLLISATDAMGNVTRYAYDSSNLAAGLLVQETYPAGNVHWRQAYDANGRVRAQTDAAGEIYRYAYAIAQGGTETTVTDPDGGTITDAFDLDGNLVSTRDQLGNTATFAYDAAGRRTRIVDRLGAVTTMTYDSASGMLDTLVTPDRATAKYVDQPRRHRGVPAISELALIEYPDSSTTSYTRDSIGNITTITDQAGKQWTMTYDDHGQMLTATNPRGGTVQYTYAADGNVHTVTDPAGNTIVRGYDRSHRLERITFADGTTRLATYDDDNDIVAITDEAQATTSYRYDANGNCVAITDPLGHTTQYGYDALDRPVSMTDALGNTTRLTYTALGQLRGMQRPSGAETRYFYDAAGRMTGVSDGSGDTWTRTVDAEGVTRSLIPPMADSVSLATDALGRVVASTDATGATTHTAYDAAGRPVQSIDPAGQATLLTYDPRGLVTGVALPASRHVAYGYDDLGAPTALIDANQQSWLRTYDTQGRLTATQDPLGNHTAYAYDALNRVLAVHYPTGDSARFTRDQRGAITGIRYSDGTRKDYRYNAAGWLTSAGTTAYQYDADGRIIAEGAVAVSRDANGRIASITYPQNRAVQYTYAPSGELAEVQDWTGAATTFEYDADGRLISIVRPNGVRTTYAYDAAGRLISYAHGAIASATLTRDARGFITARQVTAPVVTAVRQPETRTFTYDAASQLQGATYDQRGRLTANGSLACTWDDASRLTVAGDSGATWHLSYDDFDDVVSRGRGTLTAIASLWCHAFAIPCLLTDSSASAAHAYVYTPGGALLYSVDARGAHLFYFFDHRGSTIALADDSGNVTDAYAYTPYGEMLGRSGTDDNPFTYCGGMGVVHLAQTPLYLMRARVYDASTGRFLSRDPLQGVTPVQLNPMEYAAQNPLSYADPLGLQDQPGTPANATGPARETQQNATPPPPAPTGRTPQDPIPVTKQDLLNEAHWFRKQIYEMGKDSWLGIYNPMIPAGSDSRFYTAAQRGIAESKRTKLPPKNIYYIYDGHVMNYGELNYYFQGLYWSEAYGNWSEFLMRPAIVDWKVLGGLRGATAWTPSGNDWMMAYAGMDDNADPAVQLQMATTTGGPPPPAVITAAPPQPWYQTAWGWIESGADWLADHVGP